MFIGFVEDVPYRIDYISTVGIDDQIFVFIVVAGNMRLTDTLGRQLF